LDPRTAVPLIQPNGDTVWHLADPSDILNLGTPATQYGFLQGTSTQKTFFARPQIGQGANKVSIPDPPHIADVGSLLGATGIFPGSAKRPLVARPESARAGRAWHRHTYAQQPGKFPDSPTAADAGEFRRGQGGSCI